jgi:hypothetical protein
MVASRKKSATKTKKAETERQGGKARMSRQNHVCPFMKKTCIGCSVYRGRHSGLWTDGPSLHRSPGSSKENGSDWVTSLNDFFKDASIMQGEDPDHEKR